MPEVVDVGYARSLVWNVTTHYDASNIILYNLALGADGTDLSRCFEGHPRFHALPTFGTLPVIAAMGKVTQSMPDFLPNFKPQFHVHGEHYLELKAPFPKAAVLETRARVIDIVARNKGVTVTVGIVSTDKATGLEICYNEWTSFVLNVPGEGASSKPLATGPNAQSHPAPTRAPDAIVEHKTSSEQSALYRAASGDLNPLHIDPATAKSGGFPGPILTGTCTMGIGVRHVIDTFANGDVDQFQSVKLRLSKPLFPGEMVRTEMWREDVGRRIIYQQVSNSGNIVISQAGVTLKGSSKPQDVKSRLS